MYPKGCGLVVKTAAKQDCTAEGPGFESRLVHFYCSWGLLRCLFVPPRANLELKSRHEEAPGATQEPPGAPQEPPGGPRKAPRRAPGEPLERPRWAKGRRGAPGTPQNTQNPSWKQQNTVIYSVLLLRKQQNTVIYNVLWLQKHCFFEPRKA